MENTERKKKIPIGIESFEKIRTENFYYIDKTSMIRDLLHNWGEVNLFTRPRRFGKSLNMSMLKCFFEFGTSQNLFDGLAISKEKALCDQYLGKFPVISISLKSVNGDRFLSARDLMCSVIGTEALRFHFLKESSRLSREEKELYQQLISVDTSGQSVFNMSDSILVGGLKILSGLLEKHYDKKVIILIDEYDVPLAKANENGYYSQMISLIRSLFEQTLKTNEHLYFAVLTGCLRVAKESIFTGMNNLKVLSLLDVEFDEYFGFTDGEVQALLNYYGLTEIYRDMKDWYDGYRFGNMDVYCPWDVICYCNKRLFNPNLPPEDYWSNTSSNDIIRHFLEKASLGTRREIEKLISGETVTKVVRQELTYQNLYQSLDNLWSVLFMTGYLTRRGEPIGKMLPLAIPNREITNLFITQISEWFQDNARQDGEMLNAFCDSFQNGDAGKAEQLFHQYLEKTISIRDTAVKKDMKENFYHGLLLGLLSYKDSWYLTSNQETGDGYSDILIETSEEDLGIVIEIKYPETGDLESGCKEALKQIDLKRYTAQLHADGMSHILKYGIACYKKKCRIILEKEEVS